ncbi:MAG: hypothetical protein JXD18_07085 [Anaerolineae bacterium]|nr:hypothetical protein [Anaerolineae bacterium]
MELIDRYIYQVGRRLPARLRDDVTQELRSLLTDALEKRVGHPASAGGGFSEADQVAVLEEFGPPVQMAAQYQPQPQYVIGPKVYNLYLIVVAAVVGAGLIASLVSTAVSHLFVDSANVDVLSALAQGWMTFINIVLSGIGSTTLVFAVLERVIPDDQLKLDDEKVWNPRDLPEVEERNEIKPAGLIAQIGILALLFIAFNAFPERIGGAYYDGEWHAMPSLLSAAFFSIYLPMMEVRWALTIILNLVLLRQGVWNRTTRIADFLLDGFDLFILGALIVGPSILDTETLFAALPALDLPFEPATGGLKLAFAIAFVVVAIEMGVRLYRFVQSRDKSL